MKKFMQLTVRESDILVAGNTMNKRGFGQQNNL
jgi:hypothetical protein